MWRTTKIGVFVFTLLSLLPDFGARAATSTQPLLLSDATAACDITRPSTVRARKKRRLHCRLQLSTCTSESGAVVSTVAPLPRPSPKHRFELSKDLSQYAQVFLEPALRPPSA